MNFSEKLDLLLQLTNTPNSILAKALSLDPSYISRLRHGRRAVPHESYLKQMAEFFAKHCLEDYIRSALASTLENPYIRTITRESEMEQVLFHWLIGQDKNATGVKTLLKDFSRLSSDNTSRNQALARESEANKSSNLQMYYGIAGRRQATLTLFHKLLDQSTPGMLLLFSDNNSDWLTSDPTFTHEWSTLLWQIILKGNRIKVIHKISRDIDEMLEVVHQWLPFYTSGAVESYYYPRLRDGIYKRTLSVVPGCAAVFATSIGESIDSTANFMATDRLTVDSFTNEFYSYLSLCKPLIQIHQPAETLRLLPDLYSFITAPGNLILQTASLGMITMPGNAVHHICYRYRWLGASYEEMQRRWSALFEEKLKNDHIYHIVTLETSDAVRQGNIPVGTALEIQNTDICYTTEEYILHLQNMLRLLDKYENYHVILSSEERQHFSLYCHENKDVMIFKEDQPPILFELTESTMVSAFWDYMYQMQAFSFSDQKTRKQTCEQLQEWIKKARCT